ncbi:hypothetical protein BLNAU_3712 [Blattamonas nauphoetae]|uniref:Uncharacterized protein n=1 Tax=Blattamonas nauphoetae TaxID=2049346 RepID=A0ABQ9YC73_9EUKA|nr:hypothetical protein BLNAU_3712 [Blattamonas nauphoetae]
MITAKRKSQNQSLDWTLVLSSDIISEYKSVSPSTLPWPEEFPLDQIREEGAIVTRKDWTDLGITEAPSSQSTSFLVSEVRSTSDTLYTLAATLSNLVDSALPNSRSSHLSSEEKKMEEDALFARAMSQSHLPFDSAKLRALKSRERSLLNKMFVKTEADVEIRRSEQLQDDLHVPSPLLLSIPPLLSCLSSAKVLTKVLPKPNSGPSGRESWRDNRSDLQADLQHEKEKTADLQRRLAELEQENEKLKRDKTRALQEKDDLETKMKIMEQQYALEMTVKKNRKHQSDSSSDDSSSISDDSDDSDSSSSDQSPTPRNRKNLIRGTETKTNTPTKPSGFRPSNAITPTETEFSQPAKCVAKRYPLSVDKLLLYRRSFNLDFPISLSPLTCWPAESNFQLFLLQIARDAETVLSIRNRSLSKTLASGHRTAAPQSTQESQPIAFVGLSSPAKSLLINLSTLVTMITPSTDRDTMEEKRFIGYYSRHLESMRQKKVGLFLSSILGEVADIVKKSTPANIFPDSSTMLVASLSSLALMALSSDYSTLPPSQYTPQSQLIIHTRNKPLYDMTLSTNTPHYNTLFEMIDNDGFSSLATLLTHCDPEHVFPEDQWLPSHDQHKPQPLRHSRKREEEPAPEMERSEYLLKINSLRDICSVLTDTQNWFPFALSLSQFCSFIIFDHTQHTFFGTPRHIATFPSALSSQTLCTYCLKLLHHGLNTFYLSPAQPMSPAPLHNIDQQSLIQPSSSTAPFALYPNTLSWLRIRMSLCILHCMCLIDTNNAVRDRIREKQDLIIHSLRFIPDASILIHSLSILLMLFTYSQSPSQRRSMRKIWGDNDGFSFLYEILASSPLLSLPPSQLAQSEYPSPSRSSHREASFYDHAEYPTQPSPIYVRAPRHPLNLVLESSFFLPPPSLSDHLHIISLSFSLFAHTLSLSSVKSFFPFPVQSSTSRPTTPTPQSSSILPLPFYSIALLALRSLSPILFSSERRYIDRTGHHEKDERDILTTKEKEREERGLWDERPSVTLQLPVPSIAHLFPYSTSLFQFSSSEPVKEMCEQALGSILSFVVAIFSSTPNVLSSSFFSSFNFPSITPVENDYDEEYEEENLQESLMNMTDSLTFLLPLVFFFLSHPSVFLSSSSLTFLSFLSLSDEPSKTTSLPRMVTYKDSSYPQHRLLNTDAGQGLGHSVIAGINLNKSGWWGGKTDEKDDQLSHLDRTFDDERMSLASFSSRIVPQAPQNPLGIPPFLITSLSILSSPHNILSLLSCILQSFTSFASSSSPVTTIFGTTPSQLDAFSSSLTLLFKVITLRTILRAEMRNFEEIRINDNQNSASNNETTSFLDFPSYSFDHLTPSLQPFFIEFFSMSFEQDSVGCITHILLPSLFHILGQIITKVKHGREENEKSQGKMKVRSKHQDDDEGQPSDVANALLVSDGYGEDHQILSQCVTSIVSILILILSPSSLTMMNPSLPLLPEPLTNLTLSSQTLSKLNQHSKSTSQTFNSIPALLSYSYSLLPSFPLSSLHNQPQLTNAIAYKFPSTEQTSFIDPFSARLGNTLMFDGITPSTPPVLLQATLPSFRHQQFSPTLVYPSNPSFYAALYYQGYMYRGDALTDVQWEETFARLCEAQKLDNLPRFVMDTTLGRDRGEKNAAEQYRMPTDRQLDNAPDVDDELEDAFPQEIPQSATKEEIRNSLASHFRPIEEAVHAWESEWTHDWITRLIVQMQALSICECEEWIHKENDRAEKKDMRAQITVSGLSPLSWIDHTSQVFLLSTILCSLKTSEEKRLSDTLIDHLTTLFLPPLAPPAMKDDPDNANGGRQSTQNEDKEDDEDWGRYLCCAMSLAGHALNFKQSLRLSHSILAFLASLLSTFSFSPSTFSALLKFTLPLVLSPSLSSTLHSFANPKIIISVDDLHKLYSDMISLSSASAVVPANMLTKTIIQSNHVPTTPSSSHLSPPLIRIRLFFLPLFVMMDAVSILSALLMIYRPLSNEHLQSFFFEQYRSRREQQKKAKQTAAAKDPSIIDSNLVVDESQEGGGDDELADSFGEEKNRIYVGVVSIIKNLVSIASVNPFNSASVTTSCLCVHSEHKERTHGRHSRSSPSRSLPCTTTLLFSDLMRFIPSPVCPAQLTRGIRLQVMQALTTLLRSPFLLASSFYTIPSLPTFLSSSLATAIVAINQIRAERKKNRINLGKLKGKKDVTPDKISVIENEKELQYRKELRAEHDRRQQSEYDQFETALQEMWNEDTEDFILKPYAIRTHTEHYSFVLHPPIKGHAQRGSEEEQTILDHELFNQFLRLPTAFGLSEDTLLAPLFSLFIALFSTDAALFHSAIARSFYTSFLFPFLLYQGRQSFPSFSLGSAMMSLFVLLVSDDSASIEMTDAGKLIVQGSFSHEAHRIVDTRVKHDDRWILLLPTTAFNPPTKPSIGLGRSSTTPLQTQNTNVIQSFANSRQLIEAILHLLSLFRVNGGYWVYMEEDTQEREEKVRLQNENLKLMKRKKGLGMLETISNDDTERLIALEWHAGKVSKRSRSTKVRARRISSKPTTPKSTTPSFRSQPASPKRSQHQSKGDMDPSISNALDLIQRVSNTLNQGPMLRPSLYAESQLTHTIVPELSSKAESRSHMSMKPDSDDDESEEEEESEDEQGWPSEDDESEDSQNETDSVLSLSTLAVSERTTVPLNKLVRLESDCLSTVSVLISISPASISSSLSIKLVKSLVSSLTFSNQQLSQLSGLFFDSLELPLSKKQSANVSNYSKPAGSQITSTVHSALPLIYVSHPTTCDTFRTGEENIPLQSMLHRECARILSTHIQSNVTSKGFIPPSEALTDAFFFVVHPQTVHLSRDIERIREEGLRALDALLKGMKKSDKREKGQVCTDAFLQVHGLSVIKDCLWEEDERRALVEWIENGIFRQLSNESDEQESALVSFLLSLFPSQTSLCLTHSVLLSPTQFLTSSLLCSLASFTNVQSKIVDANLSRFLLVSSLRIGQCIINAHQEVIHITRHFDAVLHSLYITVGYTLLSMLCKPPSQLTPETFRILRAEAALYGGVYSLTTFLDYVIRSEPEAGRDGTRKRAVKMSRDDCLSLFLTLLDNWITDDINENDAFTSYAATAVEFRRPPLPSQNTADPAQVDWNETSYRNPYPPILPFFAEDHAHLADIRQVPNPPQAFIRKYSTEGGRSSVVSVITSRHPLQKIVSMLQDQVYKTGPPFGESVPVQAQQILTRTGNAIDDGKIKNNELALVKENFELMRTTQLGDPQSAWTQHQNKRFRFIQTEDGVPPEDQHE